MYFSSFFPRIFFIVATSISFFFLNDTVLRSFNIFQFNIKKKKEKEKHDVDLLRNIFEFTK